jgi:hypothetical protein
MSCSTDRYAATYVVAPSLGPPDCRTADFTDIQSAINALPTGGGKIFVKGGSYLPITSTIRITKSNVYIQGEGMGITNIIADQTMTTHPAIEAYSGKNGDPLSLAASTAPGDRSVMLSPQHAATLKAGDYLLLFSNKIVDAERTDKMAGEVKRVAADPQGGTVSLDDQIFDSYTLADSAAVAKITMLHNITLSDFSVTTNAPQFTGGAGLTQFRFIDNLQITRVEAHDAFISGISLVSVINSNVSDCYVHHIRDKTPPSNVHYGIVVGSASQNISVQGCRFSHTRHAVTTGGSGGALLNGVQRNIIVSGCTSMAADTAHFDTHNPAENVSFVGCVAIGGVPADQVVVGFQMRGANGSIVGCSVLRAVGKGIMIFEGTGLPQNREGSDGAVITGNMIAGVQSIMGTEGVGIYFDSSGSSRHTVVGNVIKQCEGSAIQGVSRRSGGLVLSASNDVVISGNVIDGTNLKVPGASISFTDAQRITITGNKIVNNPNGPPVEMDKSSVGWYIAGNSFDHNLSNSPAPLSADSTVIENGGYNPVGIISAPWRTNGDLTNDGGGDADPISDQVYTVRQSSKTIIITGGSVTDIAIDGTPTGLSAGVFKLGIGENILVSFNATPTTRVSAD